MTLYIQKNYVLLWSSMSNIFRFEANFISFVNSIADKTSGKRNLNVFPNPATGLITIETSAHGSLSILNHSGVQLFQQGISEPKTQVDISTLPNGVYFVRVTGDGSVRIGTFVKQ
jgi:hypothetical protein